MEEVFLRFVHLGEQIFEQLDNKDLKKCNKVNKSWNEFTSAIKLPWIRMIKEYVESSETWDKFYKNSNVETLKVIAETMPEQFDDYFPKHGTPLTFAAMSGNIDIVAELLKIQSDSLPVDEIGRTPLHYAANDGHLVVCEMIVEKFRDVNPKDKKGYTPLLEAACNGHLEVCKFIVEKVKETNPNGFNHEVNAYLTTPLQEAAEAGHIEICELLIHNAKEKNPITNDGRTILHEMATVPNNKCLYACRLIIECIQNKLPRCDIGDTPLHLAADKGNFEICRMIIDNLTDPNPTTNANDGMTLLHEMAKYFAEPCEIILQRLGNKNPRNLKGETPFHYAAEYDNFEACKLFITNATAGSKRIKLGQSFTNVEDKNPSDNTWNTPLHIAAKSGNISICKLIMDNIIDKNPKNKFGSTPLHNAAELGHFEVCKWFIENIVDIWIKDEGSRTPYDLAKRKGNVLIMKMFDDEVAKYSFSAIPESAITRPHLPPGFWRIPPKVHEFILPTNQRPY